MSPVYKAVKIARILLIVTLLSTILFYNVKIALAQESLDEILLTGNDVRIIENTQITVNTTEVTENAILYVINSVMSVNKTITVTENATVYIINSDIIINFNANVTLKNPKNGNPRFILIGSKLRANLLTTRTYKVYTYGNSTVNVNSTSITRTEFYLQDSSNVTIKSATLESSFYLSGYATIEIKSSRIVKSSISGMPTIVANENSEVSCESITMEPKMSVFGKGQAKISMYLSQGSQSEIQAMQDSEISISGGNNFLNFRFYNNSKGTIENVKLIYNVYAYDFSNVKLSNTAVYQRVRAYNHASVSMYKTSVQTNRDAEKSPPPHEPTDKKGSALMVMGSAKVVARESTVYLARAFDDACVIFVSTTIRNATFYNHSTITVSGSAEKISCDFNDYSYGFVNVKSTGAVDINVRNFGNIIIQDSDRIRQIFLDNYCKAYVLNSVLQVIYAKDHSEIYMANSQVTSYLGISDYVSMDMKKAVITLIETRDMSKIMVSSDSILKTFMIENSSKASISDSTIGEISIQLNSVQANFSGIRPKQFSTWDINANATLYIKDGGRSPSVSLTKTTILNEWNFLINGDSTLEFTDCRLNTFEACEDSTINFYNTTANYISLRDSCQMQVYWYLDVKAQNGTVVSVIDENNQEKSINVTNNEARLVLFEKSLNATETINKNKYTINTEYNGQRQQQNIILTSNILYDLIQPSWIETNWHIIVIITVIGILASGLIYRRIRKKGVDKTQIQQ
jgi:hypothetical protein